MSNILACYQLLELNVISAQDLAPVGRSMRTYAVAWTDPDRKLSTRVDSQGGTNPTWNDKFVFRVDEEFLYDENSTIAIDIYALHWFRDIHVGTAHVLAEDIIPPSRPSHGNNKPTGMRFVGLQVRRPSGRPKGILNVGVAVIDSSTRSMPLYTHNNTPVVEHHHNDINLHNQPRYQPNPELRRTKSDTSSMIAAELVAHEKRLKAKRERANSQVTPSEVSTNSQKESSLSGAHLMATRTPKRGKFGRIKKNHANEEFNATANVSYDYEIKASPRPQFRNSPAAARAYNDDGVRATPIHGGVRSTPLHGSVRATPLHGGVRATPLHGGVRATPLHAFAVTNATANATVEYGTPYRSNMGHRRPIITDSELGPSASEVAAALARQPVMEEGENSTVTGWSLDESVEDLQPKIERWRTDLAPVYDNGEKSTSSGKKKGKHSRRRTDGGGGGNGLFSCFSVICGVECSIVCGGNKKKNRLRRTQSVDNTSFL